MNSFYDTRAVLIVFILIFGAIIYGMLGSSNANESNTSFSSKPKMIIIQCVENNLMAILRTSTGTLTAMTPILNADGTPKMCMPMKTDE